MSCIGVIDAELGQRGHAYHGDQSETGNCETSRHATMYVNYLLPPGGPLRLLNRMLIFRRIKCDALQHSFKSDRATTLLATANDVLEKRLSAFPVRLRHARRQPVQPHHLRRRT